jgi:rhodanese-related sulfurtransferase
MIASSVRPLLILAAMLVCGPGSGIASTLGHRGLVDLEQDVARDYPGAPSLLPEQFEQLLKSGVPVLLLDARDHHEFAVSHIPGAQHVSPDISVARFMDRFGKAAQGKKVVVYCSVGVRSSRLAERVNTALARAGSRGAVNLRGGIFAWHNTGRNLKGDGTSTQFVHPFDRHWSRYIDFDNYTRYAR